MLKRFFLAGLLLFGMSASINTYAREYYDGNYIEAYLYNKAPNTVIIASTTGQNFQNFKGQWLFANNTAGYMHNIEMQSIIMDIVDDPQNIDAETSNKVHLEIYRDERNVGSCDFTYEYLGSVHAGHSSLGGFVPTHLNFSKPISLGPISCTKGFSITTRGRVGFPSSLILYSS